MPLSELENRLQEQLNFLRKSIRDYNNGDISEFRRMALSLRILLHQTQSSHSLINQLGWGSMEMQSLATPIDDRVLTPTWGLAAVRMGPEGTRYIPRYNSMPETLSLMKIEDWKNQEIIKDSDKQIFSRWDLIITIANQDGGAHVDPNLDEKYHKLANLNSLGWEAFTINNEGNESYDELAGAIPANVSHSAWEALTSIENKWFQTLGNRGCSCGSGRKGRYCCLKKSRVD